MTTLYVTQSLWNSLSNGSKSKPMKDQYAEFIKRIRDIHRIDTTGMSIDKMIESVANTGNSADVRITLAYAYCLGSAFSDVAIKDHWIISCANLILWERVKNVIEQYSLSIDITKEWSLYAVQRGDEIKERLVDLYTNVSQKFKAINGKIKYTTVKKILRGLLRGNNAILLNTVKTDINSHFLSPFCRTTTEFTKLGFPLKTEDTYKIVVGYGCYTADYALEKINPIEKISEETFDELQYIYKIFTEFVEQASGANIPSKAEIIKSLYKIKGRKDMDDDASDQETPGDNKSNDVDKADEIDKDLYEKDDNVVKEDDDVDNPFKDDEVDSEDDEVDDLVDDYETIIDMTAEEDLKESEATEDNQVDVKRESIREYRQAKLTCISEFVSVRETKKFNREFFCDAKLIKAFYETVVAVLFLNDTIGDREELCQLYVDSLKDTFKDNWPEMLYNMLQVLCHIEFRKYHNALKFAISISIQDWIDSHESTIKAIHQITGSKVSAMFTYARLAEISFTNM